jgi:hypothetical protein
MTPPSKPPNPWKVGPIRELQKKRIEAREAKALAATLAARVAELESKLRAHGSHRLRDICICKYPRVVFDRSIGAAGRPGRMDVSRP